MSSANQMIAPSTPIVTHSCEDARWYAVHTRCRHEKKVDTSLQQLDLATFLPTVKEVHRWSDRRETVDVPLFSCYTFVYMNICSSARLQVLKTPGVLGFVGGQSGAMPIPSWEIEQVQTAVAEKLPLAPYPFLKVGQRVRLRGGALDGMEGVWLGQERAGLLVISIDFIQRSIAVRIEGYDVEPA